MRVLVVEDDVGWARIAVRPTADGTSAELEVTNTTDDVAAAGTAATDAPGPANVGLTIVRAVLDAHHGTLDWRRDTAKVTAIVHLPASVDGTGVPGSSTTSRVAAGRPSG